MISEPSMPLLMTASISTRGMKGACFDEKTRQGMYAQTLNFYLQNLPSGQPIVFVENSGYEENSFLSEIDVDLLRRRGDDFEYLSIDPALADLSRGKGYNEIIMLNEALRRSRLVASGGAAFFKVTGRYPIYNLRSYLKAAGAFFAQGGEFYGDMKDHRLYDWIFPKHTDKWNGHAAYTVMFGSTVEFWRRELAASYHECNDYTGDWIECVWFRHLKHLRDRPDFDTKKLSLRFSREPILGGLQGSEGQTAAFSKRNDSVKARGMRMVGNVIRAVAPWFWF